MGFLNNLFGRRNEIEELMNPLLAMKLDEFVVTDSLSPRHYFRFSGNSGDNREFIVIYDNFDGTLIYARTISRFSGEDGFYPLDERGWSIPISYLIQLGKTRSAKTKPTADHFASETN